MFVLIIVYLGTVKYYTHVRLKHGTLRIFFISESKHIETQNACKFIDWSTSTLEKITSHKWLSSHFFFTLGGLLGGV